MNRASEVPPPVSSFGSIPVAPWIALRRISTIGPGLVTNDSPLILACRSNRSAYRASVARTVLQAIAQEIVWGGYANRVRIGLDYFDASINRVAAWVIGTRNMSKALLLALLAPTDRLKAAELAGDYTTRLALMEEAKTLPFGAVWDYFCFKQGVPVGDAWVAEVKRHERDVLNRR